MSLPLRSDAQQTAPRVDFGRDVQPILRDRCYACHGPEQRMNGFRLDRRGDAMRGGTQTVIGPGNAEGTKLYHRLVDLSVGARMPPADPAAERLTNMSGATALMWALPDIAKMRVLIDADVDVNARYGADQWISAAGTAWAVRALANVN